MHIVVNHLTRMQSGYICVAGIDTSSGKHIRPVLTGRLNSRLTRNLLASNGGLFDIGTIVDLGLVEHVGRAPEVEDHEFSRYVARIVNVVSPSNFWSMLEHVTQKRLMDIFGPDLRRNGGTAAVDSGKGKASLGCVVPQGRPNLYARESVRLRFTDGVLDVSASVTDFRLYKADHKTPRYSVIEDIDRRIRQGVPVILSVGLSRPWQKPGDTQERHWLQVNNIHLADNPVWQVGEEDDEDDNTNSDDLSF